MDEVSRYARGVMGETSAEHFLLERGMQVLERRFRAGRGEIDLILLDEDGTVVFAEVKLRSRSSAEEAAFAITPAKKRRMADAALHYLSAHPEFADRIMRFDAVTVTAEGIRHYPNAFEPSAE